MAYQLIVATRDPEVITPIVAPERFCDHEVIVKAPMCVLVWNMGSWSWPTRASLLDPLRSNAFNAVGGHCVLLCRDVLALWFMTAEPGLASASCIEFMTQVKPSSLIDVCTSPPL